jgi:hypothetical protein
MALNDTLAKMRLDQELSLMAATDRPATAEKAAFSYAFRGARNPNTGDVNYTSAGQTVTVRRIGLNNATPSANYEPLISIGGGISYQG